MFMSVADVEWEKSEIVISSFLTIILMPLTYSIGEGIAFGFLTYTILMVCKKKYKEIHPVMYGLAVLFIIYFII